MCILALSVIQTIFQIKKYLLFELKCKLQLLKTLKNKFVSNYNEAVKFN